MQIEDIKPGQCYIHTFNGKSLVRKVISINSNRVRYQFLSGPPFKKGLKDNSTNLWNFARWATAPIEELSDYSYLDGFIPYKNYIVLSISGHELLKCQERKVQLYLRKGMLKWINEETLQFTTDEIEKKLLHHHGGKMPEYMMTEKNKCCVVCGVTAPLTKHHIVPKKDLPHYPLEIKSDFCNLLAVCIKCHNNYELIKEGVAFEGYTYQTAVNWMNHFIETMKPKFLPKGWHILTGLGKLKLEN